MIFLNNLDLNLNFYFLNGHHWNTTKTKFPFISPELQLEHPVFRELIFGSQLDYWRHISPEDVVGGLREGVVYLRLHKIADNCYNTCYEEGSQDKRDHQPQIIVQTISLPAKKEFSNQDNALNVSTANLHVPRGTKLF